MQRAVWFVLLAVFWVMHAASAQQPTPAQDPNQQISVLAPRAARSHAAWMVQMVDQIMAQQAQTDPHLCAVVILPGPANSFTIRFGLFNVAADRLDVLIMDSFRALGGQALLHQSVFDTVAPASGTLTVHYPPDEVGKGPAVLRFTNFNQFDSAAFSTDPDIYDDPDFGATVLDMNRTSIELVFSSDVPGSRRCQGTLTFEPSLNASIANIVQVFP